MNNAELIERMSGILSTANNDDSKKERHMLNVDERSNLM